MPTQLEIALNYARAGIPVFPCRAGEEYDAVRDEVLKSKTQHDINLAMINDCRIRRDSFGTLFWCDYILGDSSHEFEFYIDHINKEMRAAAQYAAAVFLDACDALCLEPIWKLSEKEFNVGVLDSINEIVKYPYAERERITLTTGKEEDKFIYVISSELPREPICKIGIAGNPSARLKQLSTASPYPLNIDAEIQTPFAREIEMAAHARFRERNSNGEWFLIHPYQAVSFIKSRIERGQ